MTAAAAGIARAIARAIAVTAPTATTLATTLAMTLATTLTMLAAPAARAADAAAWPERPVRLVVGFAAGTGPDIAARSIAQRLSTQWNGTSVIVDNKPGAGGQLATSDVVRATPDGYTLLWAETGMIVIAPLIHSRLPYDVGRDLIPVSQAVTSDFVLVSSPDKVPAKNVAQFGQWAAGQPKGLFLGTFGAGTPGHFGAALFARALGMPVETVHYRTPAEALAGVQSGDVAGVFASAGLATPQIEAGRVSAIGSSGRTRTPSLPDVPTFIEQGQPDLSFTSWFGVMAPRGTPPALVERLAADVTRAAHDDTVRTQLQKAGFRTTGTSAAEFARIIDDDARVWGAAVRQTGFRAD